MTTIDRSSTSESPDTTSPTPDQIAVCAYHLWEQRGRAHGSDRDDWFEAESLLRRDDQAGAFDVMLEQVGDNAVLVVRTIRDATGLDLAAVKALVDRAPQPVQRRLPAAEAEALRDALRDAGGAATIARAR